MQFVTVGPRVYYGRGAVLRMLPAAHLTAILDWEMSGASTYTAVDCFSAPQAQRAMGWQTGGMGPSTVSAGLARVMAHGAPAQRAEATRLAAILESGPTQVAVIAAAEQLIDAYLNDPYLERG